LPRSSSSSHPGRRCRAPRWCPSAAPPLKIEPRAGADVAGPWCIFKMLGKRSASSGSASPPERGHRPAAVLPGTGRDAAFRLHKEAGPGGFAVETGNGVEPAGTLAFFDERLIEALANVLE